MTDAPDPVARFAALLLPAGQELLKRLDGETVGPDSALRLGTQLRAEYPAELVRDALAQQELRMRGRAKFSRAGEMFFTRDGLEQASAEAVARHRAARYAGAGRVADLCCGIGGDLIALADGGTVLGVDRDALHLRMARANAEAYGVADRVRLAQADVRDADLRGVQAVFVDPARRAGMRRLRTGDSEPPLDWCLGLADRVEQVGIKAAPGLAHEVIPAGWELEFVAVGRELKEAVAWSPPWATAARRATILPAGHTLARAPDGRVTVDAPAPEPAPASFEAAAADMAEAGAVAAGAAEARAVQARGAAAGAVQTNPAEAGAATAGMVETGGAAASAAETGMAEAGPATGGVETNAAEAGAVVVRAPGEFLFDPNPAVTRAGLVRELAALLGAWQIDEQIAFLSADAPVRTPFARTLRVIDSAPWDQKRMPARLRRLDIGAVDIRRRGLAGDVEQLHRQLKLSGSRRAVLVMTRVSNRPWGLVCLELDHSE